MTGRRCAAILAVACCASVVAVSLAGGNLGLRAAFVSGAGNNCYWDERLQPIVWYLDPNPELGYDEAFMLPALTAAIETWTGLPNIDAPAFSYGGPGDDGEMWRNTVILGDLDRISGLGNAIAQAPCDVLVKENLVTDDSDGVARNGLGVLLTGDNPEAATRIVPIGYYQRGVILECDLLFNVIGNTFTHDGTPATEDVRGIATHELGHWLGLSHTPLPEATMYKIATTNPPGDGADGMASLEPDDVSSVAHIYKRPGFDATYGTITGEVTLDGQEGDGVHVTALRASDLKPVAGRFSISRLMSTSDVADGSDFMAHGGGFYRIDGLPRGDYLLYAEWLDATDEALGDRLGSLYTGSHAWSNVAKGVWPYWGMLGLRVERFEFYDQGESADGGDGATPGAAADNPDRGTVVHVEAGQRIGGKNIALNLDPDTGKSNRERENPTGIGRHDLVELADLRLGTVLSQQGPDDDYWVLRFPASELPAPPYNVLEGIWTRFGRSDRPYVGGLLLSAVDDPDAIEPAIVWEARRLVTGWDGGATGSSERFDVRDRFNVTITEPRDLYFVVQQPVTPETAQYFSEGYFTVVRTYPEGEQASGRTLVTLDGFETFQTSTTHDVPYRVRTETAPPVMILGAEPSLLVQGQSGVEITLHGAGFREGLEIAFPAPTFGPAAASGVSVTDVQWLEPTTVVVTVDVAADAATGPIDVRVTNPEVVIPNVARLLSVIADSDVDGDGHLDALDCAPSDPTSWSVPAPPTGLTISPSGVLEWTATQDPGGSQVAYEALRAGSALGFDAAVCLPVAPEATSVVDSEQPLEGEGFYYLVGTRNGCALALGPSSMGDRNITAECSAVVAN